MGKWTHILKFVYNFRGFMHSLNCRLRILTSIVFKLRAVPRSLSLVLGPRGHSCSILVKAVVIHTLNPLGLGSAVTSLMLASLFFRDPVLLLVPGALSRNEWIQTMECVYVGRHRDKKITPLTDQITMKSDGSWFFFWCRALKMKI